MIQLKSDREIEVMSRGGRILAETVQLVEKSVAPGMSTADLDDIADKFIRGKGAIPAFKGLYGFPGSICASVNLFAGTYPPATIPLDPNLIHYKQLSLVGK